MTSWPSTGATCDSRIPSGHAEPPNARYRARSTAWVDRAGDDAVAPGTKTDAQSPRPAGRVKQYRMAAAARVREASVLGDEHTAPSDPSGHGDDDARGGCAAPGGGRQAREAQQGPPSVTDVRHA